MAKARGARAPRAVGLRWRGELVAKGGGGGGLIFSTDDCRATYERLRAAGLEFSQEPTERFYGIDCALRDPFGNPIRITQPVVATAST
jgi:uncharacterized glyoxalase superfamily protein PhnB